MTGSGGESAARSNPVVIRPVRQVKEAASPSPPRGATTGRPISRACWRLCATDSRKTVWWRWEHLLQTVIGPDDPLLDRFITAQSAAGLSDHLKALTEAWRSDTPDLPGTGLALAFAALRALTHPRAAQPVASGPLSAAIPARLTSGVAQEDSFGGHLFADRQLPAHGAGDAVAGDCGDSRPRSMRGPPAGGVHSGINCFRRAAVQGGRLAPGGVHGRTAHQVDRRRPAHCPAR